MLRISLAVLLILLCFSQSSGQPQPAIYNRFQYNSYKWRAFHTTAFHIYYPAGYDSLCSHVARNLGPAMTLTRSKMGTGLKAVPNIILYPATQALYTSNIGSSEPADKTLPTFVAKGSRLLLCFNGSYTALEQQLKTAIVRASWEAQFSEGLEEQATGNNSQKVSYWIKEGMIAWFAEAWPIIAEDALLRLLQESDPSDWESVVAKQPALAGQAFCYFLTQMYHRQLPATLYLQLRKRKTLNRALRLVTKTEVPDLFAQCLAFYKARSSAIGQRSQDTTQRLLTIAHKPGRILQVRANARQTAIAYVLATWHKRTVYLYETQTRQHHKLTTYLLPPWINDHSSDSYPLIQWSKTGDELLTVMPDKGTLVLRAYYKQGSLSRKVVLTGIDGISSADALDKNNYLLSAWRYGRADIVTYNAAREKYSPVTMDYYDDQQPAINTTNNDLFFVSNRPVSTDKEDTLSRQGIFRKTQTGIVPLIYDTIAYVRWSDPVLVNDGQSLLITSTVNGRQQFALIPASGTAQQDAVLMGPALQPAQYSPTSNSLLTYRATTDSLFLHRFPFREWLESASTATTTTASPWLNDYQAARAERAREDSILKAATDTEPSFLDGVFGREQAKMQSVKKKDSIAAALRFDTRKTTPYILQLYSAYFSARINNDYFINRYQPYAAYQGQFKFPQLGAMAQGGFSDLFEHHHFTVAFRLPAGNEGSDFFLKYRNTAKRLDWGLSYFRKSEALQPDPNRNWLDENDNQYPNTAKVKTNYYELALSYPLTYFSALDLTLAARQDKTIFQATEKYSLDFPSVKSLWSLFTLSYQLNKLQPTLPLLHKGFQVRLAVDAFKGFTQQESALAGLSMKTALHLPLYKYITAVAQLQAGHSGGDQRILYNLGGVDNNFTPRSDSSVHFAQDAPYAFQTLVTPLRGYFQNSVYGSRYALVNLDIYFPLFQSLIPLETPLSVVNNLQLGVFTDLATAGGSPSYTTANKGWQSAYGLSARTTLAGYAFRFDIGWPGFDQKPVWYLSLKL